jgi:hypothetical protein
VCSQDKELRAVLGSIPGHPLLYLNQVSLVMEPPSQHSVDHNKKLEAGKTTLNLEEKAILETLGIAQTAVAAAEAPPVSKERKKRKASEPNPLSKQSAASDSKRTKRKKLEKIKKSS